MPYVIQLLLPVEDNSQQPFSSLLFRRVQQELKDKFGGVTAYTRSPAEGQWCTDGMVCKDDIIVYEVMVPELEKGWWRFYRRRLERRFGQDELIVRALPMDKL